MTVIGQAAFPGGKADTLEETPFEIARREACEEIGLPKDDSKIPRPFRIEHLCQLPFHLAKTALAVRPCVAFLHSDDTSGNKAASVEDTMIPRLDAKEVAAVFSAPFHNFLRSEDEVREGDKVPGKRSDWYDGKWIDWFEGKWRFVSRVIFGLFLFNRPLRMHNFFVPINNQRVSKPKVREGGQAAFAEALDEEEEEGMQRYKVWGMTARMLVDAARLAYGEEPDFEVIRTLPVLYLVDTVKHNTHHGDEQMIENLHNMGRLGEKVPGGPDLTDVDLKTARVGTVQKDTSKI